MELSQRARLARRFAAWLPAVLVAGCASAPPAAAPAISMEQKLAWILRLEDQRVLRDPAPLPPPVTLGRGRRAATPAPATPRPDLLTLLGDEQARVRRSAALAIGRVGLPEGIDPLARTLGADPEPAVRQAAAFALGLLGDASDAAVAPLQRALDDPDLLVQGRAAEALGLIGHRASAGSIGEMVARQLAQPGVAAVKQEEAGETADPALEAFRLGVVALGRLKAYDALSASVLDPSGQPRLRWWPVAFALQRTEDPRAFPALATLARAESPFTRSFAARGLGAVKDRRATPLLTEMAAAWRSDPLTAVSALRAIAQGADPGAGQALVALLNVRDLDPLVLLETLGALAAVPVAEATERVQDLVAHPSPAVRAAALRALRAIDEENFVLVLSGLDPDPHWSVRAAIASVLATLDPERAIPRLTALLADTDARVIPSVLGALTRLGAPGIEGILLERLRHEDPVIRMAAASNLGQLKPAGGARVLADAYAAALPDDTYVARAAILEALAEYGAAAAEPVLRRALSDPDWSVRLKAAALMRRLDPASEAAPERPAPTRRAASEYESQELVAPTVSPQVYIETERGTVQLELLVVDAPLTADNFAALAGRGFFDGTPIHRVVPNFVVQDGDPRGDGEGGPGYTIRDELNLRPYLRGTVGMALDGPDSGGSQFFITHSPQPHLDGRYTVFARVVSGMDVVDRLQPWDTIKRVWVWKGKGSK